jgi:hypothetical protein
MNPEFQRNLWLEVTPRRVILLVVTLSLILLAGESTFGLRRSAEVIFYGLVVIWGARQAASAVIGEMRERTWDMQRMSSLTPWAMTWGKLLGSTAYVWVGGMICLPVLFTTALQEAGLVAAISDLVYFVMLGLISQSVALFTSLLAARRRQTHSRLDVFLYQVLGLFAAWCAWSMWQLVLADGDGESGRFNYEIIDWWNLEFHAAPFYLVSVFLFLGWALIGCYRLMRRELSIENTPLVWMAFLVFMAIYGGGLNSDLFGLIPDDNSLPLLHAFLIMAGLTYAAVLVEPKDAVLYRWLVEAFRAGRYREMFRRLQAWMISYAAALGAVLFLVVMFSTGLDGLGHIRVQDVGPLLAIFGLLTRDVGIFLLFPLMPGMKRGDYAAMVTLGLLYGVAPVLFGPFGGRALFLPIEPSLGILGPLIAWVEAVLVWSMVYAVAKKTVFQTRAPA